jgi:hypothetical protein
MHAVWFELTLLFPILATLVLSPISLDGILASSLGSTLLGSMGFSSLVTRFCMVMLVSLYVMSATCLSVKVEVTYGQR